MNWALSWFFYWLGDLVSRPMDKFSWLYPIYNRLMRCSVWFQGETDNGPWSPVPEEWRGE